MLTVTLLSQKGGTGKTTLSVALAVASERRGQPAVVLDLDPQGSATTWGKLRESDTPIVAATTPERLGAVRAAAMRAGAHLTLIDTAPHAAHEGVARAARAADVVLIPCRASAADLSAIGATVDVAKGAGRRTFAVINAAPVRNPLTEQARDTIVAYGIEAAPVVVHQRIDHIHGFTLGRSAEEIDAAGKAAAEIAALYAWLVTTAAPQ